MNYAQFAVYVQEIEDELTRKFGVDRESAKRIATRLELDSINAYNESKGQNQLILDYELFGPVRLAEITGVSRETLRKRYRLAIANKSPRYLAA